MVYERLTRKNENGQWEADGDGTVLMIDNGENRSVVYGRLVDRLAELEDMLE